MHIIVVYNNIFRYAKTVFTGSEITNHSIEYFNPIEYFFFFLQRIKKTYITKDIHGHYNYLSVILTSIRS